MTIRTPLVALLALAAVGAVMPAYAQTAPAVPDDAAKALWCSSAFALVAPQAKAQGQDAAADKFTKYSMTLAGTSHDGLVKAGFTEDQVKTQTATVTDKVTKELSGGGEAEFSVVDCTMLVDPTAATALQQQQAAPAPDATTPAAPAAGDATTPAPAAGDTTAAPAPAAPATPSN